MNDKLRKQILDKALRYCAERDLGFTNEAGQDNSPKNKEEIRKIVVQTLGAYAPGKRTDEENFAFDDGYDAGLLDGMLWVLRRRNIN